MPNPVIRGHGGKKPPPKGKKAVSRKAQFIWAEGQQESGGNYKIVNSSSGALGRWQVMPANLPGWLAQSGQKDMTPDEYLNDPKAQDKLAWIILGGDYDTYGAAGAAAVWYSGQDDPNATYGDPPVYQYVKDVLNLMKGAPYLTTGPGGLSTGGNSVGGITQVAGLPDPGKQNWSGSVRQASASFKRGSGYYQEQSRTVAALKIRR